MAVLLGTAVLLAGCGSSGTPKAAGGGTGVAANALTDAQSTVAEAKKAPTAIAVKTPLTSAPPKGKKIVFMQDGTQPSGEIYAGVQEAAASLGWTASSIKFNPADLATLNAGLLQALTQGANYVVDSGFPESQLSKSTVAKFEAAGVPIIVVGTTPVPQTKTLLGDYGDQNHYALSGKQLADWFVVDSQGQGKAVVVNLTTYPTLTLFTDSFTTEVRKICPACGVETLKLTIADALNGNLLSQTVAKLRSDKTIKYAVFDNSGEIAGMPAQLKASGLADVALIGHGIDPVAAQEMKTGQAKAFIAYNFRYSGWAAVDVAARNAVGQTPDKTSVQPSQLFTSDTVGQLPADAVFRAPSDGLKQFESLWQVPGA